MVLSKEKAAEAYKKGVEAVGGASAYFECGAKKETGVKAVAECMHGLKKKLTAADWAAKWAAAYVR